LPTFSECFIVGTAAEITPVRSIEKLKYTPGELTVNMVEDYDKLVRGKLVA